MNEQNNICGNEPGYSADGYAVSDRESNPCESSLNGYRSNSYSSQQTEGYGVPDYFADGYRENVFEGDLNLADTPWTETAANPNPYFKGGVNDANPYQNQTATSHFYGGDLEL
jgi:hypothetical protein